MGLVYTAFLTLYTLAMLPGGWFIDRFGPRLALLLLGFGSSLFVALTGCVGLVVHDAAALLAGAAGCQGTARRGLGAAASGRGPDGRRPASAASKVSGWLGELLGLPGNRGDPDRDGVADRPIRLACRSVDLKRHDPGGRAGLGQRHASAPRPPAKQPCTSLDFEAIYQVLRQRGVIAITLSYAAYGYFQYLFFYWITYYFETVRHEDHVVSRRYTTAITLAMGAGMFCGGWLTSQVPARFSPWARRGLVPLLGMFASGGVFEMGLLVSNPQATLAAFILSAAFLGLCEAAFWTTAVELGGRYGGTAAGLMNTGGNAGGAISPYLTPAMSSLPRRTLAPIRVGGSLWRWPGSSSLAAAGCG